MLIEESLYAKIKESMPIPCVDLVVLNDKHEILMLKRANDPEKGKWWFPGGRVHFAETREEAVHRKLTQECNLTTDKIKEIGTDDLILKNLDDSLSHAITSVFMVRIKESEILLDFQSTEYKWNTINNWIHVLNNQFLLKYLKRFSNA